MIFHFDVDGSWFPYNIQTALDRFYKIFDISVYIDVVVCLKQDIETVICEKYLDVVCYCGCHILCIYSSFHSVLVMENHHQFLPIYCILL